MKSLDENLTHAPSCPACGLELPPHVDPNHCPRCLLRVGMESGPSAADITVDDSHPRAAGVFPKPGDLFGHYRVGRLLGVGGMGAAFEAEDLPSGRQVALKVLGHRLDSPEARRRFLREGRLAASVNHPNSVYVFGTEEIAGVPVISMELMTGGNLQERISSHGPLAITRAVDYVLQMVAGLEAAQRLGILHRDIKPSNCFISGDGTIKIGDFGLSISKTLRQDPPMTVTGAFLGTPAFAAPEQLRGDEVTVRSDIYSVGVTLYYLLTGHYPFQAGDLVRLLAAVLEQRAEPPSKWRPDLPAELERVALRCLEKDPEQRFPHYEALRQALLPFASAAPTPATLGLRFLAGCIDYLVLAIPQIVLIYLQFGIGRNLAGEEPGPPHPLAGWLGPFLFTLAVYGLLEGRWGASIGKALCGLRVVRTNRSAPGFLRAAWRACVFQAPITAVAWLESGITQAWDPHPRPGWLATLLVLAPWAMMALRFSTARRSNAFAGWHDLASGTRVVDQAVCHLRPAQPLPEDTPVKLETAPMIGPYHLLGRIGGGAGEEILLGFDAKLLRRVWIHKLPAGAPPVAPVRRMAGRPGRLRWLQGRRTQEEAWDVYDALPGRPLLHLLSQGPNWGRARFWLHDLAEELAAAFQEGSLPSALDLDRVWITADGRAKLLDFQAPGLDPTRESPASNASPCPVPPLVFLRRVAASLLAGCAVMEEQSARAEVKAPLALHARRFLDSLNSGTSLVDLLQQLKPLLNKPWEITRLQRLILPASTWLLSLPILALLTAIFSPAFMAGFLHASPEMAALRQCLYRWEELKAIETTAGPWVNEERRATEVFIAGRFAHLINPPHYWGINRFFIPEKLRREAEVVLAAWPAISQEQLARAQARIKPRLEPMWNAPGSTGLMLREHGIPLGLRLVTMYLFAILLIVLPCLVASWLFRGGLITKMLGFNFVTRHGALAPRWRVAARNAIAWAPFLLLLPVWYWLSPLWGENITALWLASFWVILAILSTNLPRRGLADRLTGLWPVPR